MDIVASTQNTQEGIASFQASEGKFTGPFSTYQCKAAKPFPSAFIPGDTEGFYLTQFQGSLSGRAIQEYPNRIQHWSFSVQKETIIDEIASDPAAFRKRILSRGTPDKADTFSFPEMAPLVANMRSGMDCFLREADDDEKDINEDFVGILNKIQTCFICGLTGGRLVDKLAGYRLSEEDGFSGADLSIHKISAISEE